MLPNLDTVLKTKTIKFRNKKIRIALQNENGPCALIAIYNHQLLEAKLKPSKKKTLTLGQLINRVIHKTTGTSLDEDTQELLRNCASGLCVDIKLSESIWDFVPSPESRLFSTLAIPLCHCWLADPQDAITSSALYGLSSVEALFSLHDLSELPREVSGFVKDFPSQCTWHGIVKVGEEVQDDSLCILYKNNHFYNLYKRRGAIYLLVTDEGYKKEKQIVWERLEDVASVGTLVPAFPEHSDVNTCALF
jgi:hypothetical protein